MKRRRFLACLGGAVAAAAVPALATAPRQRDLAAIMRAAAIPPMKTAEGEFYVCMVHPNLFEALDRPEWVGGCKVYALDRITPFQQRTTP